MKADVSVLLTMYRASRHGCSERRSATLAALTNYTLRVINCVLSSPTSIFQTPCAVFRPKLSLIRQQIAFSSSEFHQRMSR